jgi:signal recognition particle subunit SRP54
MFDALRERLEGIFDKLKGKGKLTEADVDSALREVRRALLEADVDYKVVKSLVEGIRARAVGRDVLESITPAQHVIAIVYEELVAMMGVETVPLAIAPKPPTVVMMVGLQGSGKTTSTVKLARLLSRGHSPLVVACDLRRPAAVEQLKVLAAQTKVGFFGPEAGKNDPVAVAEASVAYAAGHLNDVILLDTAGRLHVDEDLMNELVVLKQTMRPTEVILVLDAMTGQEAVRVASAFHERLGVTGLVLTKLDGDARGGAALAVRSVTGAPVKFVGMGEGIDALELFDAKRMVQRIMGMGDVIGLAEKVREVTSQEDVERMADSMRKNRLTLEDLLMQLEQVEKMGPLEKILDLIPGASKLKVDSGDLDPNRLKRVKAVIQSMTRQERRNPAIIKGSRRRRIAEGSGTSVQTVNQVLKQYEQMNQLWKQFGKGRKGSSLGRLFGGKGFGSPFRQ